MTAEFGGRATVAKLRIGLKIIFARETSRLMYDKRESFDLFVGPQGLLTYPVL